VRLWNHHCGGKTRSIIYSEWEYVVLVILRAMRMRRIILSCLLSIPNFFFASFKRQPLFRGGGDRYFTQNVSFFNFLYIFCPKCSSLQDKFSDTLLKRYIGILVRTYYSYQILMIFKLLRQFFEKIIKYQVSWKIHQVGAKLFHADGRTDRDDEPNSRFWQFCERD
jgi:hypothetical protein